MSERSIPLTRPLIGNAELEAVQRVLESGWLTQGPVVEEFEVQFALAHMVEHGVATSSCTTALHLALLSLGIGPGDEVIVPSFTWIATANAVLYVGARPVFCDVDLDTFNIDLAAVERCVTPRTRAVIAVHLFGRCVDIPSLRQVLPSSVAIVEDAACAAGAMYGGSPAGSLGDIACFSFHPRKSITCGEGGMITTRNPELAKMAKSLRSHGASVSAEERQKRKSPHLLPDFDVLGFNFRMSDIQAAIALTQLTRLPEFIRERDHLASMYEYLLAHVPWIRLPMGSGSGHAWQSYVVLIDPSVTEVSRDDMMSLLHDAGISTRPGTHAIHSLGYYSRRFGFQLSDFPNSMLAANQSIAIPLFNGMDEQDIEFVAERLAALRS